MSTDRMDTSPGQNVGHSDILSTHMDTKAIRHNDIHAIGIAVLLGESATVNESAPTVLEHHMSGPDRTPTHRENECEAVLRVADLPAMTPEELRNYAIGLLDDDRCQYESARTRRPLSMMFARDCGLSCHDIGVVLGITENAVRQAMKRAEGAA